MSSFLTPLHLVENPGRGSTSVGAFVVDCNIFSWRVMDERDYGKCLAWILIVTSGSPGDITQRYFTSYGALTYYNERQG